MEKHNRTTLGDSASFYYRSSMRERESLRECTEFCTQQVQEKSGHEQRGSRVAPIDDKISHLLELKKQGVHFNLKMSEKAQFSKPGYAYSEALRLGLTDECESFIESQPS